MLEQQFGLPIKNTRIRWIDMKFDRRSNLKTLRYLQELSAISREYDLFISNSYSSLVPGRARVNLYSCMFPWVFNRQAGWLKRLARSPLYHRFLGSYEIFLSISQYTQKWVDEYWGVNSFVLYPPVRREKAAIPAQKENIVLNIGRFFAGGHNKKQDAMARAFIEMHEHGWTGDWRLVLAGRKHTDEASSRYIRSIEQMAKGYPIEFRYDIGADEMQNLLDQAKIYWHATGYEELPDLNPEKFEHFGLSTIEAALSGAVPVVFNGGGQPEIVDHARNGFLWETTDDLIKYTRLLIEDDRMWKNLSQAAFDSMEIFSDEKQLRWFKLFLSSYYRFDDR
jgi:glycosyltransferase involved in cell wall biosynthesis